VKNWRIAAILLLCITLTSLVACNPFSGGETEASEQMVEVARGDLMVTVSGSGNIEISKEANLAFGIGGRVARIFVNEGDKVKKDDVLASLKTDDLELAIAQAEVAVTQAEVAVTQAEIAVTQAEAGLKTAELALDNAQDLYSKLDISTARIAVTEAEDYLDYAKDMLEQSTTSGDIIIWTNEVGIAENNFWAAKVRLNNMLSAPDTEEVAIKRLQVTSANQSLALSQQSLTLTQQSLKLARQSLQQSQKQLDEATIKAPFTGVVAQINAKEGDIISPPSFSSMTIFHLVDPSILKLSVQVDEIDVIEVKEGQKAIIEVDALSPATIEGKVKSISLLPTIASGVTVYDVTLDFTASEGTGLRDGMSATADIIVAERSNVLLVPDRALKKDSDGNPAVDVLVNGETVERTVVTGVSDGFQTEIISGLDDGDRVIERPKPKSDTAPGFF